MPAKLTTSDFIARAKAVHGDRYNYDLVDYTGMHRKVKIKCKTHGLFEQSPDSHSRGNGCPECVGLKKHTSESFIEKAIDIHGNKYDYSYVEYTGNRNKVIIVCPEHGEYQITPSNHLKGIGCSFCSGKKKHTNKSFIEKAIEIHGDKYDYSKVEYKNAHNKVVVNCREHGLFTQTPNNHLSGQGCPDCGIVINSESRKSDTESFITQAKLTHSDTYDYSFVDYKLSTEKIIILCKTHGLFTQTPSSHLSGQGCPSCANTGFDKTKKGFLYVLRSECGRYMKIGITNKPDQRHAQLSRATPFPFSRIELIEGLGEQMAALEKELLAEYQPVDFTETFDGYSEWRLWDDSIRHKLLTFMNEG